MEKGNSIEHSSNAARFFWEPERMSPWLVLRPNGHATLPFFSGKRTTDPFDLSLSSLKKTRTQCTNATLGGYNVDERKRYSEIDDAKNGGIFTARGGSNLNRRRHIETRTGRFSADCCCPPPLQNKKRGSTTTFDRSLEVNNQTQTTKKKEEERQRCLFIVCLPNWETNLEFMPGSK